MKNFFIIVLLTVYFSFNGYASELKYSILKSLHSECLNKKDKKSCDKFLLFAKNPIFISNEDKVELEKAIAEVKHIIKQ